MKFLRRPDLSPATRAQIALDAFVHQGVWGYVTELARQHHVSRQFIYLLIWAVCEIFELKMSSSYEPGAKTVEVSPDQLLLSLRLQGHCSLGNISQIFDLLGIDKKSVGYLSERLQQFAETIPKERPCISDPVILIVDETFASCRPILVVLEARTHFVLEARWGPDRKGDTWENVFEELKTEGYGILLVVADQGSGIRKGAHAAGLSLFPDLMHLVSPFAPFLSRYERKALYAIQHEYEREKVFDNAKSEKNLRKRLQEYGEAAQQAENAVWDYEDYLYLRGELLLAFDPFDSDGTARTRSVVEGEIHAIMDLLEGEFNDPKLHAAVNAFRKIIGEYWPYFQRLEAIIEELSMQMPQDLLRELCLAWQAEKKSRGAKIYSRKKALEREAVDHLFLAACGNMENVNSLAQVVFDRLESNVRSSSPIESINSLIRMFLNSSRGQITQATLNLIVYYLNHKIANRGPYKGSSASQRLTGEPEDRTFIDQILENRK